MDDFDTVMARLAQLDKEIEREKQDRQMAVLQQLAEMGNGSPLFGALRQSFQDADPAFKTRMEELSLQD